MKLYGTTTSPFVRRVRVVAAEVGEPIERIDTAPDVGQAQLREVSPIRKVPVAVCEGRTLFDSRVIIDWMLTTHGWHDLAPPADRWHELNLLNAIDAALDAVIQLFYLRRDGVAIDGTPYATRQLERADAIFAWLDTQLAPDGQSFFGTGFGLAELALVSTLDWMDFRKAYPTERAAAVESVRAAWRERPSLASTRPHT
ncbi:MAG TPA: glutathione S-transferase family protein [Kofleriaceae bacterium]